MQNKSTICALPEDFPAFICNQNGNIVFLNKIAEKLFNDRLYGKNITDILSCKGKLQFEIAMKSKMLRPFTDEAVFASDYSYFTVVPGNISFNRLATVVISQSNLPFTPDYSAMPVETLSNVINALLSPDFNCNTEYDDSLFDAQKAILRIKDQLNSNSFLPNRTVFSEFCDKAENFTYICDCPLHCFTSLICALAYITDSLSSSGKADMSLSYYHNTFEVKIATATYLEAAAKGFGAVTSLSPLCRITADICSLIAGSNNCTLDATCENKELTFRILFNYPDFYADFKSNDPFKRFNDMFDEICNLIIAIYKEEAQE